MQQILQCPLTQFPIKYLGLLLALRPLTKAEWQSMLDKVIDFIPAWQKGMIAREGRLTLVKTVIAAKPVHHLLVADASVWLLEEVEKWMRSFFWAGSDKGNGGQCLVARSCVAKPLCYDGPGVKDLRLQGLALCTHWEWLCRTDGSRPW